jgi:N-acetylmuramoyl-L-alanine amidase
MTKRKRRKRKLRKSVYVFLFVMALILIVIIYHVSTNREEVHSPMGQSVNLTISNTNNDSEYQNDIGTLASKTISADSNGNSHTIILDPGHGGTDPGSIGADGTLEKNLNLSIAQKLQKSYTQSGYTVIMTREDDRLLCDSGLKTPLERENSDLNNRIKIMVQNPKAIFISIH